MPAAMRVLVVVSFYDARPMHELEQLLQNLRTIPAGWPFDVRVVVNRDGTAPLGIAERHPEVAVMERPNAGYNIGAWDHGWRADPAYDAYLFLQHECTVLRDGWLAPFVERANEPGVGLVGERLNPAWSAPWAEIEKRFAGHTLPGHEIDGAPVPRLAAYSHFFATNGIDRGARGDHLQTLVLFATRATLEAIGGFPVGRNYGEAIAAEIAISKKVEARGLAVRQVGERPFLCFTHPQWSQHDRPRGKREPRLGLDQWLRECRERRTFGDAPWLLLGKGPTFARLTAAHRATHRTFGLNHVVREVSLDIAHAIDVDVVTACSDALRTNCRFLLMPRVPHVSQAPGQRALEDWFAEIPVLDELDRSGRLVWYTASTAKARPGSCVIEVRHFSSEAAMQILAALGARRVRSLGIDGGRSYSASFADLDGTTRLANGKPLFDLQFEHLREIVARSDIDYAPLVPPLRVRIDASPNERLAARVAEYGIRKHASVPVEVVIASSDENGGGVRGDDSVRLPAAAIVHGDVAVRCADFERVTGEPWLRPGDPESARWVDLFAEAVNAGMVTPELVRDEVRTGRASPSLLRLPVTDGSDDVERRVSRLQRELANLRLSATYRIGEMLIAPVRAALRRFGGRA